MVQLSGWSTQQRQALTQAINKFKSYTKTESYQSYLKEQKERKRFFQEELRRRLDQLSEADVEQIVSLLWAYTWWRGNKALIAQKITKGNGLESLQKNLRMLYSEKDDPEEAYDRFLSNVRGWGPASVTEMLTYIYPDRCCIWNEQTRKALKMLGLDDKVKVKAYRPSKEEYRQFNSVAQEIAKELRQAGLGDVDMIVTHLFLYHVATSEDKEVASQQVQTSEGFDHDEIRDLIANIGTLLGFDTETEVHLARGARVDVVWRARIANLGQVTYVFEVHRSGSIDSLILNLQKALNASPTVQKVIAVSDKDQLQRIESESADLPEQFRRALRLWDVTDVIQVARALEQAMGLIAKLRLQEI